MIPRVKVFLFRTFGNVRTLETKPRRCFFGTAISAIERGHVRHVRESFGSCWLKKYGIRGTEVFWAPGKRVLTLDGSGGGTFSKKR